MVSRGLTRRGLVKTSGEWSPVCFWVQSYNIQEAESSFMCIKMCITMCIKICITTHITMYITICITMYITHLLTTSFSALCAALPTCTASAGHIYSLSPPHAPYKPLIQHKHQSPPPSFLPMPPVTAAPLSPNSHLSPLCRQYSGDPIAAIPPPVNMWITP